MKSFEKIRLIREMRKLSQENLAEALDISINAYSKIERGETRLTLPRLNQIATILEVDATIFLHDDEPNLVLSIGEHNPHGTNINGTNIHLYGSTELAMELDKLKLIIEHKDEMLAQKQHEIEMYKEMLAMFKNKPN